MELDEKDKIIIEYLMHDCRITTTKLAKLTHLAQSTVVYRIQKLENEGYISKYDAVFNHNLLKTNLIMYFVKVPENHCSKFEKEIEKNSAIESLYRLANKMNYCISGFLTNNQKKEIEYFLKSFKFKSYIWKNLAFIPFSIFPSIIKEKDNLKVKKLEKLKVDESDIKLINALNNGGGRDSIFTLSEKTGLTDDVVLYRFKKLKSAGAFPIFIAQPGTKRFSLQVDMVIFKVKDKSFSFVEEIFRKIEKSVHLVQLSSGEYFTQILTSSFEEYKQVLDKICSALRDNLTSFETYNTKDWLFLNRINLTKENFY